jgi:hypothetical protein
MAMERFCCERMAHDLSQKCSQHDDRYDCPDALIAEVEGGFGLIIHDGGNSSISISFCPWCGTTLPQIDEQSRGAIN